MPEENKNEFFNASKEENEYLEWLFNTDGIDEILENILDYGD